MGTTLNLFEFWEKVLSVESNDLEHKVYILQQFSYKIRKEFFKNNFMPLLKDLMSLISDIDQVLATNVIHISGQRPRMIDNSDLTTREVLETARILIREIVIEGSKRWHVLLDSIDFTPNSNSGTLKITMPSLSVGLFINFDVLDNRKIILFKDIGLDAINDWTWDIDWEYDIPKETIKHILKEKINSLKL